MREQPDLKHYRQINTDKITHCKPQYLSTVYKLYACVHLCLLSSSLYFSNASLFFPHPLLSICPPPFPLPAPPFSPLFSPPAIPGQQWQRQSGLGKDQAGKGGVSYTRRPLGKRRPSHIAPMTACRRIHPDLHIHIFLGTQKEPKVTLYQRSYGDVQENIAKLKLLELLLCDLMW